MKYIQMMACSLLAVILFFTSCTTDPIVTGSVTDNYPDDTLFNDGNPCPEDVISFQHEVLPILVSNCAFSGCHDSQTREDDIVLESYADVIKEITPNDPGDSELYKSIVDPDPEEIMPPPPYDPLTSDQITLIRTWIEQGAENTTCGDLCDSSLSSFAADIFPLVRTYCLGCHNDNQTLGNVNLKDYNQIKPYVDEGSFLGSIKHDPAFSIMPPSGGPLNDCRVAQIEKWIAEGALNN